jgi:hypothetical protein
MTRLTEIFTQSLEGIAVTGGGGGGGGGGAGVTAYATIAELPLSDNDTGKLAFVEENNRLYIWNGTGWFNIALINTNPTITQGPDPSYVFATDGTPIVLTLVAEDPEGIPITWSSQVTSGTLGNTATISQNGNVFTITPSTDSEDVGTFGVTFTASDGVNIATAASSFTLLFAAADPFYNQSVVLTTSAVNNGNNNVFVDSSTNNFAVTRSGNTTQGTFSPFSPAGWSGYFDGTGDALVLPSNSAFALGTGPFCIEAWIYNNILKNFSCLVTTRPNNSNYSDAYHIGWDANGGLSLYVGSTPRAGAGSGTMKVGKWQYLVCCRNASGLVSIFVDGIRVGTQTVTENFTRSLLGIGDFPTTQAEGIIGYISSLRIVKGNSVYDPTQTTITVPTEPLTAIANTSLLTLQDNRFKDNSTNNFAITRVGDTRITPFSPFIPQTQYSPVVHGGSAYFDGTGDYLVLGSDVNNFAGDVTVECWIYPEAVGTGARQWLFSTADNGAGSWAINIASGSGTLEIWLGGYSFVARNSTIPVIPMTWNHIALVRLNGTISLYINGVSAMATATSQWGRGSIIGVGLYYDALTQFFKGYMSGFRYITGTAVYTGNFIPPTAPATPISGTYRLLNFTNSNIYDETGKVVVETVGDARVSTSVVKYGDSSMYFDGTGDYLLAPNDPVFDFPDNFTIEMWVNFVNVNSTWQSIISRAYGIAGGWRLYKNDGNNQLRWYSGLTSVVLTTGSTLANNTWHHIAVVRNSGTVTIFIDGINRGSATNATAYTPGNYALEIGSGVVTSAFPMTGYISDLRITKGHARYTANFTPPTQKLGYTNAE